MDFTIGTDPEFMLATKKGKIVSAIPVITADKYAKMPLKGAKNVRESEIAECFHDNVLVEVNVPSAGTRGEFVRNVEDTLASLAKAVRPHRLVIQASHNYSAKELEHEDAKVFGCDPEFCIYDRTEDGLIKRVEPPVMTEGMNFRSAGGHIHLGHDLCLPFEGGFPVEMIQTLDIMVGCTSVLIDKDPTSKARKALYGGAGTHRVNPAYGLEYRTLSNFWLASPAHVEVIWELCNSTLEIVDTYREHYAVRSLVTAEPEDIRRIVNEADEQGAAAIYEEVCTWLPEHAQRQITNLRNQEFTNDLYDAWAIIA